MSNQVSDKPYYVILTGSKNNAGDYLIKYRAKELFAALRPDRDIIDIDGWKKFDDETLKLVNGAECLILMGGPALQKNMYPGIYPLVENLDEITCKIALMGVGWKSRSGRWLDSQNYPLGEKTKQLLKRIDADALLSSVRDYHTMNVLNHHGLDRVLMTGCPATYVLDELDKPFRKPEAIRKVGFSLGVSFIESKEMKDQMEKTILGLVDYFGKDVYFEVVFHHSTKERFLKSHNATKEHLVAHLQFIDWLDAKGIKHIDISGSAENLINYYSSCDLHIGYRVHAHIFMNSINKASILIAEDGRGKALRAVFGGLVIDAFSSVESTFIAKVLRKLKIRSGYHSYPEQNEEIESLINYEIKNDFPKIQTSRYMINSNFKVMKSFFKYLP